MVFASDPIFYNYTSILPTLQAVVDIGDHDFALGLSYVAMSRVRSIDDLLLQPFGYKRMQPTDKIRTTLELRQDFLNCMATKL